MSKTKIIGVLLIVAAVAKGAVDILDGGGFDFTANFNEIRTALEGAGLIFLRMGIDKIK